MLTKLFFMNRKDLRYGEEQDALEFCEFLYSFLPHSDHRICDYDVENAWKSLCDNLTKEELKRGWQVIVVHCGNLNCKKSLSFQTFNTIYLPVTNEKIFLQEFLNNYSKKNLLQNNYCKCGRQNSEEIMLCNLPEQIIFSIKKFEVEKKKVNVDVKFPVSSLKISSFLKNEYYTFQSASLHFGESCRTGHYTSIRRENVDKYIYFDDESTPQKLSINDNCEIISSSSKLLFFQKDNYHPHNKEKENVVLENLLNYNIYLPESNDYVDYGCGDYDCDYEDLNFSQNLFNTLSQTFDIEEQITQGPNFSQNLFNNEVSQTFNIEEQITQNPSGNFTC